MTSRRSWFVLALFGCALPVLTGTAEAANHSVVITYNFDGNNNCTQTLDSGTPNPVVQNFPAGDTITYTAQVQGMAGNKPFELQYTRTGPFSHSFSNAAGLNVTPPFVFSSPGTGYGYQIVRVNGQTCVNEHTMGIIMR